MKSVSVRIMQVSSYCRKPLFRVRFAKDYYNIKSDYVLEVDITPNRADACSHYGVARDLYAYLIQNGKQATFTASVSRWV